MWILIGAVVFFILCLCGFWEIAVTGVVLLCIGFGTVKAVKIAPKESRWKIIAVVVGTVVLILAGLFSTIGVTAIAGYIVYKASSFFTESRRTEEGLNQFAKDGIQFFETIKRIKRDPKWHLYARENISEDDWLKDRLYSHMTQE